MKKKRLIFPRRLQEEGNESAKYNIESGELVVSIPKLNEKEFFPDLEMLTTLLKKRETVKEKEPLISENESFQQNMEDEDFQFEQKIAQQVELYF